MKLLIISLPTQVPNEGELINAMMAQSHFTLHLRKPMAEVQDLQSLIEDINPNYHSRLVLHDCFELAERYTLKGLHLNRRNPVLPKDFKGSISRSCHSWLEVNQALDDCDYLFISPLFDSISKPGYKQAFSTQDLQRAKDNGLINSKVIGLGGITPNKLPFVSHWGMGGVAVLGSIWGDYNKDKSKSGVLNRLHEWSIKIKQYEK